ncbi:MAG: 50S ribosomal protein L37Ae [Euryarchaeota archaeon]|nr:50S ribosomal protein L37Ae [Euryarchaeota archaeon]
MRRTKKAGISGKFGPRYGMRTRKKWLEIEKKQRPLHRCPVCKKMGVKRLASGIWSCRKCGAKYTGGAYLPKTAAAGIAERTLKRIKEER